MNKINWFILMMKRYLPVTLHLTLSKIKKNLQNTKGGILWWIIEPLFYTFIYYFVFAVIFQVKTENFGLLLLFGLLIWRWVALSINMGAGSVFSGSALMRQIDIPKIIFPIQAILAETIPFLIGYGFVFITFWVLGLVDVSKVYLFPIVFGLAFYFLGSLGLITSIIMPFIPDLRNVIRLGMRALVFVSGVFYLPEQVPEKFRVLFMLNPFAVIVDSLRRVSIFGQPPEWEWLIYVFILSTLLFLIGLYMHIRLNRVVPRYLI